MDELVDRYLVLLEVPEDDRPRQRQKLSQVPEDELRRELQALTDIFSAAEERISASDQLWQVEEAQRRELYAGTSDSVQDWLRNALVQRKRGLEDAFAPFQDRISCKHAMEDLHRFYLGVPREYRDTWANAIVGEASAWIQENSSNPTTFELAGLVKRIGALPALVANGSLAPRLLIAHSSGRIDIPTHLLLAVFSNACLIERSNWIRWNRLVDPFFEDAFETGTLSPRDFERLGTNLTTHSSRAELSWSVQKLRMTNWRSAAFKWVYDDTLVSAEYLAPPHGLDLEGFDQDRTEEKIDELEAA